MKGRTVKSLKSGINCFGFIVKDNDFYLMGQISDKIIFEQPQIFENRKVKDFGIQQSKVIVCDLENKVWIYDFENERKIINL